eukprot:11269935-Alexandrium_andersonii.AAC.1
MHLLSGRRESCAIGMYLRHQVETSHAALRDCSGQWQSLIQGPVERYAWRQIIRMRPCPQTSIHANTQTVATPTASIAKTSRSAGCSW